ncbi:bifunctional transcriptional activator/DNA repair enzyme AdaA [Paenibacillus cremeus]|uniref:Methylphosphotriester-DNA--protein-cysteine methyltransferase family protein n=1 Tax=Paenibacillus cremeus TaxID=2163881 RepID=A0A559KEI6_9BACL|nr:bifunctional transcriptional activator/DNA repair enzyme AdaA [Paenibacillus cremeus]TVY10540.1 methylphosphotriester-DNA--protein-cysteine methyltransferase family protein [Paenibacillus cremeus]
MITELNLTEERWQAIATNNASFDGTFYYAVTTTGIFCRPSCKSRIPNREHVRVFLSAQRALEEDFRPCKRCKPDDRQLPEAEWVSLITRWLEAHYAESITLKRLAEHFHGSPYHLQRTFKRLTGLSPSDYTTQLRISHAQTLLSSTDRSIMEIAESVGMPNAAHFSTVFLKHTGFTPTEYRQMLTQQGGAPHEAE